MATTEEVLTLWGDKLEQLSNALVQAGKEYGPDVIGLTLNVVRVGAIGNLLIGLFLVLLLTTILIISYKFFKYGRKERNDDIWVSALMVGGFSTFLFGSVCAILLLDIWNWVGIFEPKLLLAKRIFEGVL